MENLRKKFSWESSWILLQIVIHSNIFNNLSSCWSKNLYKNDYEDCQWNFVHLENQLFTFHEKLTIFSAWKEKNYKFLACKDYSISEIDHRIVVEVHEHRLRSGNVASNDKIDIFHTGHRHCNVAYAQTIYGVELNNSKFKFWNSRIK